MGTVYAEITLKNGADAIDERRGIIDENAIRLLTVNALVDTGAYTLVINEGVREKLGLELRGDDWVKLANGETETVRKADPVEVQWENRTMICQPVVLPGIDDVLLGAIPMEDMDLMVDPKNEKVIGRHGDKRIGRV